MATFGREIQADDNAGLDVLVTLLSSKNSQPPPRESIEPYVFPADFDRAENERVINIRDKLLAAGTAAFPHLINGLDNVRYSHTTIYDTGGVHHWRVNEVCLEIIRLQVEVYRDYARPIEDGPVLYVPSYLPVPCSRHRFPKSAKTYLEKWWQPRRMMNLAQVQFEAATWMSEYEDGRGYTNANEEEMVSTWYKSLRDRLRAAERPIRVDWEGRFIDEESLKPTSQDFERWYEARKPKKKGSDKSD